VLSLQNNGICRGRPAVVANATQAEMAAPANPNNNQVFPQSHLINQYGPEMDLYLCFAVFQYV
jgi:hypothetical protein